MLWYVGSSVIILAEINGKNLKHHAIYYFCFRHGTYNNLLGMVPINQLGRELQKYREIFVACFL
jgi:hypothetical protein